MITTVCAGSAAKCFFPWKPSNSDRNSDPDNKSTKKRSWHAACSVLSCRISLAFYRPCNREHSNDESHTLLVGAAIGLSGHGGNFGVSHAGRNFLRARKKRQATGQRTGK